MSHRCRRRKRPICRRRFAPFRGCCRPRASTWRPPTPRICGWAACAPSTNRRRRSHSWPSRVGDSHPGLSEAIATARTATEEFASWLRAETPKKTGPSGIGKEQYTWYLRNVLLVPLSWEEEVTITKRELARAHTSLRLEENRNRRLPPLATADTRGGLRRASGPRHRAVSQVGRRSADRDDGAVDGAGAARAHRVVHAAGVAQLLRRDHASRSDPAVDASLSLVGQHADPRRAARRVRFAAARCSTTCG